MPEFIRDFFNITLPELWHVYKGFILLLVSLYIVKKSLIKFYSRKRKSISMANFILGVNNLYFLIVIVVIFFLVLRFFGITVHEFFTSIAIVAAALAIVFRDYILNGLNGMVFILGDNITVGDYVKIENHKGMIKNISLVAVHLMNDELDLVMLPNNMVMGAEVINYTKNPHHNFSLDFTLPMNKAMVISEMEDYLIRKINDGEELIRPKEHALLVHKASDTSITYTLQYNLFLNTTANQGLVKSRVWDAVISHLH